MKKLILISIIGILFFTQVSLANAEKPVESNEGSGKTPGGTVTIDNPIGDADTTPQELIGRVISAVLGISGSLALLMFIYGGFTWMLSGGNSEKVTKGKNTLVWASIGLIVIFSSYAMVKAVFTGLGG
jgi:hypothetical protein